MTSALLSVVIPAYNEEERLGPSLEHILSYLKSRAVPSEILVVDDGSTDGTPQIAQAFSGSRHHCCSIRFLRNDRNRGKGYSVRRGMLEALGRYALFTDADLSAPIEELPKLERCVIDGRYAVALGSRALEGSRVEVHQSFFRETSGKIFNRLMRWATGLPYQDTQCGFKLFQMDRCKDIFRTQQIEDFGFDVEVLYIARKWGLAAAEIPVVWRQSSGSRVHFIPDAAEMLLDLIRIRWHDARGKYERVQAL